jgi:drug/metabolite transporter (DMT)-like permease
MKRLLWTVGMGIVGLLLGLKGQDTPADIWWTALTVIWAASIGYGFGTIFDQKHPTKRLVIYWAGTLGLVGCFFGLLFGAGVQPYATVAERGLHGGIGAFAGALSGLLLGTMQLKRLRRKAQASHSGAVA